VPLRTFVTKKCFASTLSKGAVRKCTFPRDKCKSGEQALVLFEVGKRRYVFTLFATHNVYHCFTIK